MFKSSFRLGMIVAAGLAVFVCALSPDIAHAAATFKAHAPAAFGLHDVATFTATLVLAVGLEPLKVQLSDLTAKASAKRAELVSGLSDTAVAAIETAHAALMVDIKTVKDAIAAEETKGQPKAWAGAFYASAAASNIPLVKLNEIVAASASHEAAKDALIDAMAAVNNANLPSATGARASVGAEAREKLVTGVTRSLIARAAIFPGDADGERNEFSGMSMREIARMALERNGITTGFGDPMAMIAQAMQPVVMAGALSTSDFTNILANVANKAMLKGYGEADETFERWTGKGQLSDFKVVSRVDLGLFPNLDLVAEGAEYKMAKLTDRGVTIALATYGKIVPITRQAIINDDLNAFTKVPQKMGRAAHRTVGNLVYAILTANAAMPDGTALFHASKGNLATGGGSALSATSLDAGRAAMAKQTDKDAIAAGLNIRPKHWIGPVALDGQARQIFASQAEPGQSNPNVANRVAGMADVISDARLDVASTTAWYLSADPSQTDTIEVDYLNGIDQPTLESRPGWNVDGVEFKVRHDAGVNLLDRVGLYKSAGA